MGRLRLTPVGRARAGVLAGGAMVTVGTALAVALAMGLGFGVAVGLFVGGVLLVAYFLLLTDTDKGGSPWLMADEADGGGP